MIMGWLWGADPGSGESSGTGPTVTLNIGQPV